MTTVGSFFIWVGVALFLKGGVQGFWHSQIARATRQCQCMCGQVFGQEMDYPKPSPDETWIHSERFGPHATVCFVMPVLLGRLDALQARTDEAKALREEASTLERNGRVTPK